LIDSPHAKSYYGGAVAAPVWQRIADAALRHRGVPPTLNAPPPVVTARRENPSEMLPSGSIATTSVMTVSGPTEAGPDGFPDLRGLSARDAIRSLARMGLTARVHGKGVVTEQRPEPGTPLDGRTSCELWLERDAVDSARGRPLGTQP
jgi:hypothetical protein